MRKTGKVSGFDTVRATGDVPRWVRGLFDLHERRMDEMKREHSERMDEMERLRREDKAAHEARMDRLERQDQVQANRVEHTHQLTLKVLVKLSEQEAQRVKDRDALARVLRIHGARIERVEKR